MQQPELKDSATCTPDDFLHALPVPAYIYHPKSQRVISANRPLKALLGILRGGGSKTGDAHLKRLEFPACSVRRCQGSSRALLVLTHESRSGSALCFPAIEQHGTRPTLPDGGIIGILEERCAIHAAPPGPGKRTNHPEWSWNGPLPQSGSSLPTRRPLPRCLGYTSTRPLRREQWLGKVHPEDASRICKELIEIEVNRTTRELNYRMLDSANRYIPVRDVLFFSASSKDYHGSFMERLSKAAFPENAPEIPPTQNQLASMIRSLLRGKDDFQRDLSLSLHDDVVAPVLAVKLQIEQALRALGPQDPTHFEGILNELANIASAARNLCTHTWPAALEIFGPLEAIHSLVAEARRQTGLVIQIVAPRELPVLPRTVSTALYRITQEALTNIARHACASRVHIEMSVTPQILTLSVQDNGVGIPRSRRRNGVGIMGMKERAASIGAQLSVASLIPSGTAVICHLPIASMSTQENASDAPTLNHEST